jgi:diadenylate cyclase
MKLHTLSWIVNQILAVGLLAFVVLFQPELRRMVDHLGNVNLANLFSASKPVQEMELVITQTVNACRTMSQTRTGALIVFAREQNLDEYIRHGVLIDGHVSEQLLRTIFFLNTDLHDKAVIIQNGRLAAARCKLPEAIAPLPAVLSELGTRHNSAVGMSQASDAVVVVVSEQTGTISVAVNGMLKRELTPDTLEKLLRNELCPKQEELTNTSSPVKVLKKITGQEKERNDYDKK